MEFLAVNGEPVKRNQDLVLKILLDDGDKILDLNGAGAETTRMKLDSQGSVMLANSTPRAAESAAVL